MKFNMGCGRKKTAGWINVDAAPGAEPDELWDLERTPWPWPSGCATELLFNHSLEHMGGDPKVFLAIMAEIYRIAAPGCRVTITVPHPRHDSFLGDPTHVRPITPQMLHLFDRELNDRWEKEGAANTPLALYMSVDFKVVSTSVRLEEPYASQLTRGEITQAEAGDLMRRMNNVASEYTIVLEARKPTG